MKTRFLAAFLLTAAFAGQALAADIADMPAPSVGGFYAGVQAGGASGDLSLKEYDAGTSDPSGYTGDIEATGVIGGIYAGFNYPELCILDRRV